MNKPNRIFIKPAPGRMLRDLNGNQITEAGREVVLTTFWQRRLNSGDAIKATQKKERSAQTEK